MSKKNFFSAQIVADVLSVSKRNMEAWEKNGKLVPQLDPSKTSEPYHKSQLTAYPEFQAMFESSWDQEHKTKPNSSYGLIELFAGAGGLAIGLEKAGFKNVLISDRDKDCCATLKANRPDWTVVQDDIRNIDFSEYKGQVDLLTGGFPCQPFSYAGKKLGFEDARGTEFFEFARAVKETQPKAFLIENVKGLATDNEGATVKTIVAILEELGYTIVEQHIYKALFYKVPQKRERLIIIGVRNDLAKNAIYERPAPFYEVVTVKDALKKGVLYKEDVPESVGQAYPKRKAEILQHVPQGGYWRDLPIDLQKEYMMKSFYLGGGKTGMARRLSWDEPSLTLTCSPAQKQTERCHPEETRPLAVREYARIQTFPDDWEFCGSISSQYKQIGNAVPVNLSEAVGLSVVRMLNNIGISD